MNGADLQSIWLTLINPLFRLLLAMCIGLLIANLIEGLHWTRPLARLSAPLIRMARLGDIAGASFSLAFFSPSASNALLAESHTNGEIGRKELILANLFNSLPAYMVHLPTMLFLLWPVLGTPSLIYTGLTLIAAMLRTLFTAVLGHWILPPTTGKNCVLCRRPQPGSGFKHILQTAWKRLLRRIPRLFLFTIPVYILMFFLQSHGFFQDMQNWLSTAIPWMDIIKPELFGIVLLSLAAEIGASLSAAGAALHMGTLAPDEVILALLIGNILSTPMRTIRHQFPAYAGYYSPGLALQLILINQSLRAASMIGVTWIYWNFIA